MFSRVTYVNIKRTVALVLLSALLIACDSEKAALESKARKILNSPEFSFRTYDMTDLILYKYNADFFYIPDSADGLTLRFASDSSIFYYVAQDKETTEHLVETVLRAWDLRPEEYPMHTRHYWLTNQADTVHFMSSHEEVLAAYLAPTRLEIYQVDSLLISIEHGP